MEPFESKKGYLNRNRDLAGNPFVTSIIFGSGHCLIILLISYTKETNDCHRFRATTFNAFNNKTRNAAGRVRDHPHNLSLTFRSRRALLMTDTELRLIASPAITGLSSKPKNG